MVDSVRLDFLSPSYTTADRRMCLWEATIFKYLRVDCGRIENDFACLAVNFGLAVAQVRSKNRI
jgi:hypothetical protein